MTPFTKKSCLTQEQMHKYIEGRLSDKERFIIEKHLIDCDLCSEAVEGLSRLSGAESEASVTSLGHRIHTRLSGPEKKKSIPKAMYAIAAVVILGLISVLTLFTKKPLNEILFDEYFKPYPNTVRVLRGDETESQLNKAMFEYEKAHYKAATQSLEQILESEPENITAHFYTGICQLALNNPEKSIDHFQFIINQDENKFTQHARWYLGLAMLKKNDLVTSRTIFQNLVSESGLYSHEGSDILKNLNQIKN